MANPNAYRTVDYLGGRYLEARELLKQQAIDTQTEEQGLGALYRTGAVFNITPTVSGQSVVLVPTNSSLPMQVMLNGNFEPLVDATGAPLASIALDYSAGTSVGVYLNYEIHIVSWGTSWTLNTDPTLLDPITGEPTANMGELRMTVTNNPTLPILDPTTQLEVNTSVITLFGVTYSGGVPQVQWLNNANYQALATGLTAGLVSLTDNTGDPGIAVADDDYRLYNERVPVDGSVTDIKVAAITTTDGHTVSPSNTGGITSDKIIYTTWNDVLTWVLDTFNSWITALQNAFYNQHQGQVLGEPGTTQASLVHPIPASYLTGNFAPLSHVGLPMDLSTSHQPLINSDTDGFVVVDTGANPDDWSFLTHNGSVAPPSSSITGSNGVAGITHGGDGFYSAANAYSVTPGGNSPDGTAMYTGTIGWISNLAHTLEQHVNQNSHANPHGLTCADIGAATVTYVDSLHYPMTEELFLGYYGSGQSVAVADIPDKFISPLTGYQYSQTDVVKYKYVMTSTRPAAGGSEGQMTDPGASGTNPAGTNYVLYSVTFQVNASTLVTYNQVAYWGVNGADAEEKDYQGYGEVYALCQRS
jgi:hypothetical protein